MAKNIVKRIFPYVFVLIMGIGLSACTIPQPMPEEGVWYCEELMIELDFSVHSQNGTPYFAKMYNPDGSYQDIMCHYLGSNISFYSMDWEENYLNGYFLYRNGVFSITTIEDEQTYVFKRVDPVKPGRYLRSFK